MRYLGFSGRILSVPQLSTYDTRPLQQHPHLSLSLVYLHDILRHLAHHQVFFYRLPHQFAPYLTHPEQRWFHQQVEECATELALLNTTIAQRAMRVSLHLPLSYDLCNRNEYKQIQTIIAIERQAALLYALGGSESVLVAHLGGTRTPDRSGLKHAVALIEQLQEPARSLLALEHDDYRWNLGDLLEVHEVTATPIVFDLHHFRMNNPQAYTIHEALNQSLATWPQMRTPKIHLSSPRTELRIRYIQHQRPRLQAPRWNEHSDYIHPFELIDLLHIPTTRNYDLMIEAKAGDLAFLRAREALVRFAPELRETYL